MRTVCKPVRLYTTVNLLDKTTVRNLKSRPIISKVGTHSHNAAKVQPTVWNHYAKMNIKLIPIPIYVETTKTTQFR